MVSHMITIAADAGAAKTAFDLMGEFSRSPIRHAKSVNAFVSRFLATIDRPMIAERSESELFTANVSTPIRETPTHIIDRLRSHKNWTIEELAARAGLNIKQVYKLKRGEGVHMSTISKLAAVLGCEPGDLIPPGISARKSQP
jgi:DNA-binding Xre family transcriptional regulator